MLGKRVLDRLVLERELPLMPRRPIQNGQYTPKCSYEYPVRSVGLDCCDKGELDDTTGKILVVPVERISSIGHSFSSVSVGEGEFLGLTTAHRGGEAEPHSVGERSHRAVSCVLQSAKGYSLRTSSSRCISQPRQRATCSSCRGTDRRDGGDRRTGQRSRLQRKLQRAAQSQGE